MTEGPVGAKAPVGLGELESVMARAASPMGRFERYLPLWMALYFDASALHLLAQFFFLLVGVMTVTSACSTASHSTDQCALAAVVVVDQGTAQGANDGANAAVCRRLVGTAVVVFRGDLGAAGGQGGSQGQGDQLHLLHCVDPWVY